MENATVKLPRACFSEDRCGAGGQPARPYRHPREAAPWFSRPPHPVPSSSCPCSPQPPGRARGGPGSTSFVGLRKGRLQSPVTPSLMGWAHPLTEAKMSTQVALLARPGADPPATEEQQSQIQVPPDDGGRCFPFAGLHARTAVVPWGSSTVSPASPEMPLLALRPTWRASSLG